MSRTVRHAAPANLLKKGFTHATETAPLNVDFRVKGAGTKLALLFREELLQRLANKAAQAKAGAP
ncbi:hypothetical protein [Pseudoxanthomonas sp. SE1]|uniref:hypothetical protein n=1 Tax=Pseudoxanthomonas sp. SE1 TaxID=1664560 RepID=UPI00240D8078|nr:hypothetical protein [Pseudoxanthomonas sp. SE1]WFC43209.1 hypothetical protein OY559_06780 [Pseudoxanthomonas sp. SE1]